MRENKWCQTPFSGISGPAPGRKSSPTPFILGKKRGRPEGALQLSAPTAMSRRAGVTWVSTRDPGKKFRGSGPPFHVREGDAPDAPQVAHQGAGVGLARQPRHLDGVFFLGPGDFGRVAGGAQNAIEGERLVPGLEEQ